MAQLPPGFVLDGTPQQGPVYGPPPAPPKPRDPLQVRKDEIDIAKGERELARGDAPAPPAGYRFTAGGNLEAIPGGPADKPGGAIGKLTEGERKGGAFLKRALGAYQQYEALGVGPRSIPNNIINEISPTLANTIPSGLGGNDPSRQQAAAAENEFLTAILRQDSGATITPDELESQRRIYFPQPGEDPPTVEAKRVARLRALEALIGTAGGSADPEIVAAIQALSNPPVQTELATGETRFENDPRFAGLNEQVSQMIASGVSPGQVIKLLREKGASAAAQMDVLRQIQEYRKFKADMERQGKQVGPPTVDLERQEVPNTALNRAAASPLGTAALTAADTFTGGHLDNIVGMTGGDAEQANLGIQLSREQNPGAALAGDVAGGATAFLTGSAATRAAGIAPQAGRIGALSPRALAGDAALGGYVASGQGGTQIVDPGNVALGAVTGAGAGAATRGALNAAGAALAPNGGRLGPVMEAGTRPTVGQRLQASDNALLRKTGALEEVFSRFPVLGASQRGGRNAAMEEMQRGAFNEALGEIGLALPKGIKKGTQAHAFMQRSFDAAYDKARSGMQFAPDGQWTNDLSALQQDVALLSKDSQNTFKQMAALVGGKLNASGGALGGDQYKLVVSRIDKKVRALRSNPNGDTELADALESFKTAIDDAARRQSSPDAGAALDAADRGYAKAVVIENAARMRGGDAGEFNGNQLEAAVQRTNKSRRSRAYLRGEATMQEYANSAKALGDFVPNSGTPEQLATLTAGGLAAGFSPAVLAPWAVTGVPTLPGVRQGLATLMAPRPQGIRGPLEKGRSLVELIGGYGAGPASVPLVTE